MSESQKMLEAIHGHDLEEAQRAFEEALDYDSAEDLFDLVDALYDLGYVNYLEILLDHLLARYPQEDSLRVLQAEIYFDSDREEEAMSILYDIKEDSPAYVQSLLLQADIYLVQDFVELAEAKLIQAKELSQDHPVLLFALAELYFSQQVYFQAQGYYDNLIAQDIKKISGVDLLFRLALTYSALGEWEMAVDLLKISLKNEDRVDKRFQLALAYYQLEDYDLAIQHFEELLNLDPTYSSAYPYLIESYLNKNLWDKAKEVLDQALAYDTSQVELYSLAGLIYQHFDQVDQALAYYLKAIEVNPSHIGYRLHYLYFLYQLEDYTAVIEKARKMKEDDLDDASLNWILALAYSRREEYDLARQSFEAAYPELQDSSDFMIDYLHFLREEGDWDRIKNYIQAVLEKEGDHPWLLSLQEELNEMNNQ